MDSALALKDATHYFPWYFFKISCFWKNIIMLSHLNLKSTIPVQTTAYARKLHLNSVTDRLMQFQITLKLWEASHNRSIGRQTPLSSICSPGRLQAGKNQARVPANPNPSRTFCPWRIYTTCGAMKVMCFLRAKLRLWLPLNPIMTIRICLGISWRRTIPWWRFGVKRWGWLE